MTETSKILGVMNMLGWSFFMFLAAMIMIAIFLVLHELWRYLRDRNAREAAEARIKFGIVPVRKVSSSER